MTSIVIPIILRHGDYVGSPFSKLQVLPTDAVPVTDRKWRRDEAFFNVVQGIRKVVEELHSNEWLSKGNEHFLCEQYKEALHAFEQAIFFNPSNADAYVGKGNILRVLDWDGKAKDPIFEAYAKALHLNPKHENAYIGKANALLDLKEYEEALASFERAISVAAIPNRNVYKGKGDVLSTLERFEEAIEAYNTCVRLGLDDVEVYQKMGKAFFEMDKYQDAIDAYEKALTSISEYRKDLLARAYRSKGNIWQLLFLEAFKKADELELPEDERPF